MKRTGILFLTILIGTGVYAQNRLTPELLWKLKRVGDVKISNDGKKFLYGVTEYQLKENKGTTITYLSDASGKSNMLFDGKGDEYGINWHNNNITYVIDSSIYQVTAEKKNKKELLKSSIGIGSYKISGNNNTLVFTSSVKLDQTVQDRYSDLPEADAMVIDNLMYRHWDSWHDFNFDHLFVSTLNGDIYSAPKDIMKGEKFDAGSYSISPDGTTIAYHCKKKYGKEFALSTNTDIYLYDIATGKTTNISKGMMGYDRNPAFSNDGSKIAWESMARDGYESDKNRIIVYDLKTGKWEDMTANFAETLHGFYWSGDDKSIYFKSGIEATEQIFKLDLANKKTSQLTSGMHNYRKFAYSGGLLIGERQSISVPSDLYSVNLKSGDQVRLTKLNEAILKDIKLGEVKKRMVKTSDGKDMLTWVIYPPGFDASRKYPTLLYCQGGPQAAVSQFFSYRWNFQLMAANDYIIVAPNRRGLPSFGIEWNEAISGDWGGQAIKDYLSAIDDLSKEEYVDKDKLGAVGASYGGYSVYQLAGVHNKRFKTFISHCGLFNLDSWYSTTEEMFFANWDIGGAYWDNPKPVSYEKFSPHRFVGNWDTPILVIHGQKDFRVPVTQGMEAFNSAQLKNIPSRFLYFPNEGHWVMGPQNGVLWHREFFRWLDNYLK